MHLEALKAPAAATAAVASVRAAGGDSGVEGPGPGLSLPDEMGMCAIHWAALNGHLDSVILLLEVCATLIISDPYTLPHLID